MAGHKDGEAEPCHGVIMCYAVLWLAAGCDVARCATVNYCAAVLWLAVLWITVHLCFQAGLCCTLLCCGALCCAVDYCALL